MTRYLITPSGARDLAAMADRGELANPNAVIQDLAYTIEHQAQDDNQPTEPLTHHTPDCDLLIRHRACDCGYAASLYARSADL